MTRSKWGRQALGLTLTVPGHGPDLPLLGKELGDHTAMRSRCPCAAGQFWAGRGLWLWGLQTRGESWWALLLSIDPGSCGRAAQTLGSLHRAARTQLACGVQGWERRHGPEQHVVVIITMRSTQRGTWQ